MLDLGKFNKLLIDRWAVEEARALAADPARYAYGTADEPFPLIVWPGGVTSESPLLPYLQYDQIIENKYKAHQILKKTEEVNGQIIGKYKNPSSVDYQYALISDSEDRNLRDRVTILYNYLTTDAFAVAMQGLNMVAVIMTPISQLAINKSDILERRYFFDIRISYADNFEENETDVSVIETAEATGEPVGAIE